MVRKVTYRRTDSQSVPLPEEIDYCARNMH